MKLKNLYSRKYFRWLTLIAIFLLLFLRRPDSFTNSQFWAEDGSHFFKTCFEGNISLFTPDPDTIQLIPRIILDLQLYELTHYLRHYNLNLIMDCSKYFLQSHQDLMYLIHHSKVMFGCHFS